MRSRNSFEANRISISVEERQQQQRQPQRKRKKDGGTQPRNWPFSSHLGAVGSCCCFFLDSINIAVNPSPPIGDCFSDSVVADDEILLGE